MKRLIRSSRQLDLILESNPAEDEIHTWIRNDDDILTFEEAFADGSCEPDFTDGDIDEALRTGYVTVYSSKPIVNGTFVTPSKLEASAYSGNGYIYSAKVRIDDIAWIDDSQGQLATDSTVSYIKIKADRM
jgi:hypothetical protein